MQVRRGAEQFQRIGGHALDQFTVERWHQVQAVDLGQPGGLFACFVEVATELDHFAAKATHGVVLFHRVAQRHHDQRPQPHRRGRQCHALAVVAAGGGDNTLDLRMRLLEPVHEGDAPAHLEGAGRGVVFMLDPHRAAQAFGQQRPGVLRRGGHDLVNLACRLFDVVACQCVHGQPPGNFVQSRHGHRAAAFKKLT
ncbi:hypothetical protein D3C73_1044860 [compost metagenome]